MIKSMAIPISLFITFLVLLPFTVSILMICNSYKMTKDYDDIKGKIKDNVTKERSTGVFSSIKTFMQRMLDPIEYISKLDITEEDLEKYQKVLIEEVTNIKISSNEYNDLKKDLSSRIESLYKEVNNKDIEDNSGKETLTAESLVHYKTMSKIKFIYNI